MDLNGVDSDGVSDEVIDVVEQFREEHEDPTNTDRSRLLTLSMRVSQRDAEYIVECVRLILVVDQAMELSLDDDEISDEAIELFGRFLHETPCRLQAIWLWKLPQQQMRRLLAALHTNRSVKKLVVRKLHDNEGALWVADLLRHKTDFTDIRLGDCRFRFTQILPLLRGQLNLQALAFIHGCCSSSNENDRLLLFNDPEFTQLFVDNLLLSPSTTLKRLWVINCGVLLHNRPLMAAIHKNTTLVEVWRDSDDPPTIFIDPILRRNRYLGYVHDMLGTRMTTMLPTSSLPAVTSLTLPAVGVGEIVIAPTILPPCGLWSTVMSKVGQGTQGASPVFTILRDRLATWMAPSYHQRQLSQQVPQQACQEEELEHKEQQNDADSATSSSTSVAPPSLQNETSGNDKQERAAETVEGSSSSRFQLGTGRNDAPASSPSSSSIPPPATSATTSATTSTTTARSPTVTNRTHLGKQRAAPKVAENVATKSKKPKKNRT